MSSNDRKSIDVQVARGVGMQEENNTPVTLESKGCVHCKSALTSHEIITRDPGGAVQSHAGRDIPHHREKIRCVPYQAGAAIVPRVWVGKRAVVHVSAGLLAGGAVGPGEPVPAAIEDLPSIWREFGCACAQVASGCVEQPLVAVTHNVPRVTDICPMKGQRSQ